MNEEQPTNRLSKRGKQLIGAGFALIFLWWVVNYVPSTVAAFAAKEPGKTLLFWANLFLFIGAIAGVITICILVAGTKEFKISKIKFGAAELTFKKDDIEVNGESD